MKSIRTSIIKSVCNKILLEIEMLATLGRFAKKEALLIGFYC